MTIKETIITVIIAVIIWIAGSNIACIIHIQTNGTNTNLLAIVVFSIMNVAVGVILSWLVFDKIISNKK